MLFSYIKYVNFMILNVQNRMTDVNKAYDLKLTIIFYKRWGPNWFIKSNKDTNSSFLSVPFYT